MTSLVAYLLLFTVVGVLFLLVNLLVGKLVRPSLPNPEKHAIYECGEPTIGSSWVQFDLRFYVVALLFIIFDVEVAFFFPWAVVFGKANQIAAADGGKAVVLQPDDEVVRALAKTAPQNADDWKELAAPARRLARLAFVDILIFFGVLLVGFAYLWKRGDLDWVRAMSRERAQSATAPPLRERADEMAGVG